MLADKHDRIKVNKTYGLKFHPKYKYCENSEIYDYDIDMQRRMKEEGYKLTYIDGCFKPFLTTLRKK